MDSYNTVYKGSDEIQMSRLVNEEDDFGTQSLLKDRRKWKTLSFALGLLSVICIIAIVVLSVLASGKVSQEEKTKETSAFQQGTPCDNQPCFNGGLCKAIGDNFTCTCSPGFSGSRCEVSVCDSNPCSNGGLCQVKGDTYKCTCDPGFSGDQCDVGPCDSSPCLNSGTCDIIGNTYSCTCMRGFSGGQCQISACDSNPCQNEGICKVSGDSYICGCLSGYFGRQCEEKGYSDYVIMFTEPPRSDNVPRLYIRSSESGTVSVYSKIGLIRTIDLISGDQYIVPTFKPSKNEELRKSLLGVVSLQDNTQVQIKFRIPVSSTKVKYKYLSYGNGETLTITLSKFQTLQISHIYDLSGSIVTSNKPVGVVSGNKCNAINNFYCNAFIEMVLPVNQLVKEFIIPTIAKRNDSVVRVYCHEATELKISTLSGEYSVDIEKENFHQFDNSHLSTINANETVLVVSFPKDIPKYDAYMMTIPGIQHYKSYYNFTVPTGYTSYISVTYLVTTGKSVNDPFDGFKIDNKKLSLTEVFNMTINEFNYATFSQEIKKAAPMRYAMN
ncbi:Sushi, nidogen and EGF-like domain-containing protein 1 [Mytilus edulis]|uniref:Sushi, nidogen and EGF-like domain-containing protein 1 n=1 Tax=Mytilus edulis TaxID=6550 RepID=A0A8S3QIQ5_MYTED|nr:Sushi, nidogen and EGF-like domain-containing protein 1 [Mytilus edulis]